MPVGSKDGRKAVITFLATAAIVAIAWSVTSDVAVAQAHNPFGVGISEGGGSASGISGWLLAEQAKFELMLSGAVRAAKSDGSALWFLSGLAFLYGVFHAAGPGHGKAVVASYMFANERVLRRGVIISFLAAALQGIVAIVLVGTLALVFHATAQGMKEAAQVTESLSYAGISLLGLSLVWRKGRALPGAWRAWVRSREDAAMPRGLVQGAALSSPGAVSRADDASRLGIAPLTFRPFQPAGQREPLTCVGGSDHTHGPGCGHFHAPDPAALGNGFSWSSAAMTVAAAGLRPCSGAILVLVFALAQGIFVAGVYATLAMSLGTALTTSGLATLAVVAGGVAVRLSGRGSARGELLTRVIETGAGAFILLLGLGLLLGVASASGA